MAQLLKAPEATIEKLINEIFVAVSKKVLPPTIKETKRFVKSVSKS